MYFNRLKHINTKARKSGDDYLAQSPSEIHQIVAAIFPGNFEESNINLKLSFRLKITCIC